MPSRLDIRIVLAAFLMDMLPRVLISVIAVLLLGWIFGRLVSPPTTVVWIIIVTGVASIALARVCAALLIVAAVTQLGSDPTNAEAMAVAITMASPRMTRLYLVRLGVALALGVGIGLLMLLLDSFSSPSHRSPLTSFLTGLMTGVVYIYLSSGWELARMGAAVSARRK
jgi:hypothetical protein